MQGCTPVGEDSGEERGEDCRSTATVIGILERAEVPKLCGFTGPDLGYAASQSEGSSQKGKLREADAGPTKCLYVGGSD